MRDCKRLFFVLPHVCFLVIPQSITSMVVAEFQGNLTSTPMPASPRHPTVSVFVLSVHLALVKSSKDKSKYFNHLTQGSLAYC